MRRGNGKGVKGGSLGNIGFFLDAALELILSLSFCRFEGSHEEDVRRSKNLSNKEVKREGSVMRDTCRSSPKRVTQIECSSTH